MGEQTQPAHLKEAAIAASSAQKLATALKNKRVAPDDPAFIVLQALEMSLRALEEIPAAMDRATEQRLAVIEAAHQAATSKAAAASVRQLDGLFEKIEQSTIAAAAKAANSGVIKTRELFRAHLTAKTRAGYFAGAAVTLLASAAAFQAGRYVQAGYVPPIGGPEFFRVIWFAPAGWVVTLAALAGLLAEIVTKFHQRD